MVEIVNILFIGKHLDSSLHYPVSLDILIKELSNKNVSTIVDVSSVSSKENQYHPKNLYSILPNAGITYTSLTDEIPSHQIIKDELYYDLLSEEEQQDYQVSVLFDQFCLHKLCIHIYNSYFKAPHSTIAILTDSWYFKDILRIHFCVSVLKKYVNGINVSHLLPVNNTFRQSSTQEPNFLTIDNTSFSDLINRQYDSISSEPEIFTSYISNLSQYKIYCSTSNISNVPSKSSIVSRVISVPKPPINLNDYLVEYVPMNKGGGEFTKKILDFKNGHHAQVEYWKSEFICAIEKRNILFDCVVRALGSNEQVASGNSPLDEVGKEIEKRLNISYKPELLKKTRVTRPMKSCGGAANRLNNILRAYSVMYDGVDYNNKRILIIDDIYTTGSTCKEISRAILSKWPTAEVYGQFLARTV